MQLEVFINLCCLHQGKGIKITELVRDKDQSYFSFEKACLKLESGVKKHISHSTVTLSANKMAQKNRQVRKKYLLSRKDNQQQLTISLRKEHICVFLNYFNFHHF